MTNTAPEAPMTATITRYWQPTRFGGQWRYESNFSVGYVRPDGVMAEIKVGSHTSLRAIKDTLRRRGVTTFILAWETK